MLKTKNNTNTNTNINENYKKLNNHINSLPLITAIGALTTFIVYYKFRK
jgi:hypothetical protein